jgi:hypothetical protein
MASPLLIACRRDLAVDTAEIRTQRIPHFKTGADKGVGDLLAPRMGSVVAGDEFTEWRHIDDRGSTLVAAAKDTKAAGTLVRQEPTREGRTSERIDQLVQPAGEADKLMTEFRQIWKTMES